MLNFLQSDVKKKKNENLELSRHLTSNLMYFMGTLTEADSTRKERSNSLLITVLFASYASYFTNICFSVFLFLSWYKCLLAY